MFVLPVPVWLRKASIPACSASFFFALDWHVFVAANAQSPSTKIAVGPLVAALIVVSGFSPVIGTADPPVWETKMARHTLTAESSESALTVDKKENDGILLFDGSG